ncbi:MAG: aldehyde ferredoxin oxidoreductase family protein [Candidatus Cloacimonetes bacterium]|nr:aldehyde ferredoxin oxidoreductase family protein [Candidatus Cloacimonadota bacterium]
MFLTAYINLEKNKVDVKESPQEEVIKFLGSRGYAAKILYDNVGPEIKPYDVANMLIFSTGLFTGTAWPTSARFTVTAKSPATEAYGYANSGGFFGPELRRAGFDAIVIKGKAEKPVYLHIKDENIEIKSAEHLWNKKVSEVSGKLKSKYNRGQVACIGPAGENMVRFSSIMVNEGRAAGRCGMGAVMGSKKLKAVVVEASQKVPFNDDFKMTAIKKAKKLKDHPSAVVYREWGTPILINFKNHRGDLPAKNHQEVQVKDQNKINAQALDKYVYKNTGCYACPVRCSRHSRVEQGPYKCDTEGPEYETIDSFGPMVGNDDLEMIIYANEICDENGIDTISSGVVIAFAMECYQKGYLKDIELNLEWGNKEAIIKLLKMIIHREGLGDILAEGVMRASKKIDPETQKFALHVKGLETPQQEPRTNRGLALGHATSNRGADHLYGLSTIDQTQNEEIANKYFPESDSDILDVFSQKYKPEMLKFTEEFSAISDALGICKFSTLEGYALDVADIVEGLNEFDESFKFDFESLMKTGERIINLERMYNYKNGMNREDDILPERFLNEPVDVYKEEEGILTKELFKENLTVDLDEMLDSYYQIRKWNKEGIPTKEKLKELDLDYLLKY